MIMNSIGKYQIIAGNKLIASYEQALKDSTKLENGTTVEIDNIPNYHENYSLLMPVVEKINGEFIEDTVVIMSHTCIVPLEREEIITVGANMLEAIWLAVVEYLKYKKL